MGYNVFTDSNVRRAMRESYGPRTVGGLTSRNWTPKSVSMDAWTSILQEGVHTGHIYLCSNVPCALDDCILSLVSQYTYLSSAVCIAGTEKIVHPSRADLVLLNCCICSSICKLATTPPPKRRSQSGILNFFACTAPKSASKLICLHEEPSSPLRKKITLCRPTTCRTAEPH